MIEWAQKFKKDATFNTELESENSKIFISNVLIDNKLYGTGKGLSKKQAEQRAAKATMDIIELEGTEEILDDTVDNE